MMTGHGSICDKDIALKHLQEYAEMGQCEQLTVEFFDQIAHFKNDEGEALIETLDAHDNYTPLISAAKNGKVECVRILCELGHANIDKKAGWNETNALMKAAEKGHNEVVFTLLELGADINLRNSFGNTALMLAAEKGRSDAVTMLLSWTASIDMDVMNQYQYTALILAAENGYKYCVELLLKFGANANLRNMFGKTALIMAAENGEPEVVEVLCDSGADVNIRSKRGVSALMLSAVKGHFDCAKVLTRPQYGTDIHVENNDKSDNALTMACLGGKAVIVKHLVDLGAQVHYRNANKETVLMKACERGDILSMDYLLSYVTSNLEILLSLTAQNKHGNTCLMRACSTGNLQVMVYLMEKLSQQLNKSGDLLKSINRSGDTAELARLLYNYPTSYEFVKACYRYISNKDGDTAMTLLSKYYRDNPKKFNDFVIQATRSHRQMYLFDMFPSIFPNFASPNTVLNGCKEDLFSRLRAQGGYKSDLKLLSALVNVAAALKLAAEQHPLESREMVELFEKVEGGIKACMFSTSMDVPANVTKILRDAEKDEQSDIVRQALAFVNGPLELCIRNHITGLLGTAQICTHVHNVFFASLRPIQRTVIRELPDIFQVRSGCTTFRYRPAFMFLLEGMSKALYLGLVAYVSSEDCGAEAECELSARLNWSEVNLVVMVITGSLFEVGEILNGSGFNHHVADVWNALDIISNSLVLAWLLCRQYQSQHNIARGCLALSAVPMSIGLLRFLSTFQYLGQLVIVIFAMSQDLGAFLLMFLMSILGFGIAFHSLFPDREEFAGASATFLTLFNAALGDHNFESFQDHRYQYVGISTMALYVMFVTIILLNLIVARMSSTFQKMNEKSFEQWSMVMAKNVQDWLMISEKTNPLCMIPPPFNAISIAVLPWDMWERQKNRGSEEIPSICGSVSDTVIGMLTAPVCAALEVYLVNAELWSSQIPRKNALFVTIMSVLLFPLWYSLYLVVILHNIWSMQRTRISKRTNRIIYETQMTSNHVLRKFIVVAIFVIFSPFLFLYFFDMAFGLVFKSQREKLIKQDVVSVFVDTKKRASEITSRDDDLALAATAAAAVASANAVIVPRKQDSVVFPGIDADSLFESCDDVLDLDKLDKDEVLLGMSWQAKNQWQKLRSNLCPAPGETGENRGSSSPTSASAASSTAGAVGATGVNGTGSGSRGNAKNGRRSPFPGDDRRQSIGPQSPTSPLKLLPRGALHAYEENAIKIFFFVTAPVWFMTIFAIRLCILLSTILSYFSFSKRGKAPLPPAAGEGTGSGPGAQVPLGGETLDLQTSNTLLADDPEVDAEQLSATKGKLEVKLLRLNFQGQVGLFGRRANTYVRTTYGRKSEVSPTVLYDPSVPLTHTFFFELTNRNSIKFQVFDKDTTDSAAGGSGGSSVAGVMMAEEVVDIRPWIANGRFEGDQELHRNGREAGLKIQLAVKLSYPGRKRVQKCSSMTAAALSMTTHQSRQGMVDKSAMGPSPFHSPHPPFNPPNPSPNQSLAPNATRSKPLPLSTPTFGSEKTTDDLNVTSPDNPASVHSPESVSPARVKLLSPQPLRPRPTPTATSFKSDVECSTGTSSVASVTGRVPTSTPTTGAGTTGTSIPEVVTGGAGGGGGGYGRGSGRGRGRGDERESRPAQRRRLRIGRRRDDPGPSVQTPRPRAHLRVPHRRAFREEKRRRRTPAAGVSDVPQDDPGGHPGGACVVAGGFSPAGHTPQAVMWSLDTPQAVMWSLDTPQAVMWSLGRRVLGCSPNSNMYSSIKEVLVSSISIKY